MDTGPDARPIGPAGDVETIVMAGQAERAGCQASHGHEVSAVVPLPAVLAAASGAAASGATAPPPGAGSTEPLEALRPTVQKRCDDAFEGYVGKAAPGSIYETFAALPTTAQWQAGENVAVCLVARRDGRWMAYPARGSGQ
jgi:hypothetical protein